MRWLLLPLGATLAAVALAQGVRYHVDPGQTRVEFSGPQIGLVRAYGRFVQAAGSIVYDPVGQGGRIDLDVAADSVRTGLGPADALLRGEHMFDAGRHPVVRFRSTGLVFAEGRLARVEGELTVRGVTRPVTLVVTGVDCGGEARGARCVAEADGTLRRREFGMDFGWPLIGDDVDLHFSIVALRDLPVTAKAP